MATFKACHCRASVFSVLLGGMLLYGCGSGQEKLSDVEPPTGEVATRPTDEALPIDSEVDSVSEEATGDAIAERLAIAGIKNPQAAKAFIAQMNTAATAADRQAIAELVHYPFTTYDTGNPVKTYATPAELLADFEQVVTPSVIAAMSEASYNDVFANYKGAMIGDGKVWFGQFDEGIKISAINSQ